MKKLITLLLPTSLLAAPDARFEIFPTEGNVIAIGCESEENTECAMQDFTIDSFPNFYKKSKFPGLTKAPEKVLSAISSAAEVMGDVEYVHVAVTLDGTTYEYMFDRNTGWNSFRAIPTTQICRLECKVKPIVKNE